MPGAVLNALLRSPHKIDTPLFYTLRFWFCLSLVFGGNISLCSSSCPDICCVTQAGTKLTTWWKTTLSYDLSVPPSQCWDVSSRSPHQAVQLGTVEPRTLWMLWQLSILHLSHTPGSPVSVCKMMKLRIIGIMQFPGQYLESYAGRVWYR